MKVAIITDTHYGARKSSRLFHNYFEKFYRDIFFPTIDAEGIDTIIHMGDAFDSRKGIDFTSLDWAKRVVFDPIKDRGITMHLMVGNHDAYYKNTNDINTDSPISTLSVTDETSTSRFVSVSPAKKNSVLLSASSATRTVYLPSL